VWQGRTKPASRFQRKPAHPNPALPGGRNVAILEEILERALKEAQEAEVFHVVNHNTPALFEANRLKLLETRETAGVALRVIKEGRIGFASTTNLQDIQGLVDRAIEVTPFGSEAHLVFPSSDGYPSVEVYDPQVEHFAVGKMIQLGQGLIDTIRANNPDVQCDGHVSKGASTISLLNSRGGSVSYTRSVFGVSLEGTLIQGTDMLFVGDGQSWCQPIEDTTLIRESVREQLALARTVAPTVSGSLPVIFTPHGVAGTLIGPLLAAFNGRTVLQGASPLVGRLGDRIVDQRFSLWDDPTVPYAPASSAADDEGVPSYRKALIDHGVAATFLYDLQTAGQAGTTSTGNATRSLASLPSPAASVLLVDEGNVSYDDMVRDMQEGIIVEHLLGAGQGNILAGDFNANVLLGYRVSQGNIVGRVKDTVISGNVYDVLNNLVAIGDRARWVGGSMRTPAIYCRDVSVSAKK